ncbi:MAG TPA: heavy-metal-associated domain-containing protein [Anaerolineaceae bacterium]|jgi:copper ion binding protein
MTTITYNVPSISCKHCVHTINTELSDLAGVSSVDANLDKKLVTVQFDSPATKEQIEQTMQEINYPVLKVID